MIIENLDLLKIHSLSEEQYLREKQANNLEENSFYITDKDNNIKITQETGNSESYAISQKVITNELNNKNNIMLNALKGSATGEIISLNDISPVEHNIGVKVSSKNLIPYPYYKGNSYTYKGITWIVDDKGIFTVNGTAEGTAYYSLIWNKSLLEVGETYTLSVTKNKGFNGRFNLAQPGVSDIILQGSSITFVAKSDEISLHFYINSGAVIEDLQVSVQLEKGTTATAYTPYIADIEAVKVKTQGKNLANIYGFGAGLLNNGVVEGLTNRHGTTISTTESNSSIEVIQETVGDSSTQISYKNGYLYIGMNSNFQEGEAITISFDLNIKSNPLNAKTMGLFVNGVSEGNFNIENNKCYKSFNWVKSNYENSYFEIRIAGCSFVISNIQLELGETATEYEPYKGLIEYTQSEDIKSIYPTTTLTTDTTGALIECEYNRDINKAFAELQQVILSLGGNV